MFFTFYEATENEIQQWFINQKKCKYHGVVTNINDYKYSECASKLTIELENFIIHQSGFNHEICGNGSNFYIQYDKETIPKIGDEIFGIVDQNEGIIIREGKSYYYMYPEIPDCILKDNNIINNYSTGKIENISSGNTINNNLEIKKQNNLQKKIITSTTNETKEIKSILENQTKENIIDFSGITEQIQTETGNTQIETKQIELNKQEGKGDINYFGILGVILIIFIVFIVFIYKLRKNKKQD